MTPIKLAHTPLIIVLFLTLAACSSSDSSDPENLQSDGTDSTAEPDIPATSGSSDSPLINDPTQVPDVSDDESGPNGNPVDESDSHNETDSGEDSDSVEDSNPDDNAGNEGDDSQSGENMGENTGENTDENTSGNTNGESTDDALTEMLIPPVTPGSDLDRLVQGLTRQASMTLLDLNRRISQGETLTEQQESCLGPFEEGHGEPLLSVSCDEKLVTGDIELWVGEAAFYNTQACREALFNQSSDACILQRMSLTITTDWQPNPNSGGRPIPAFGGAEVAYAIDDTMLSIDSTENNPFSPFSCDISLETLTTTGSVNATNCGNIVKSVADEIERLQDF